MRKEILILFAVCLSQVALVQPGQNQTNKPINPPTLSNDPMMPLQLVSASVTPNDQRFSELNVVVKNITSKRVVAYTLMLKNENKRIAALTVNTLLNPGSKGIEPEREVNLRPFGFGNTLETKMHDASDLKVVVDFALLENGLYFGKDEERVLPIINALSSAISSERKRIINSINQKGADTTINELKELSNTQEPQRRKPTKDELIALFGKSEPDKK